MINRSALQFCGLKVGKLFSIILFMRWRKEAARFLIYKYTNQHKMTIHQCLPILSISLLPLKSVFSPHTLGIDELGFPRLNITIQVRNQLVFVVTHTRAEVSDAHVCLFAPPQIGL